MKRRKSSKDRRAVSGIAASTAAMTTERRTCEASAGYGEDATAVPSSHATSSRLSTLTRAPAAASSTPGRPPGERSAQPGADQGRQQLAHPGQREHHREADDRRVELGERADLGDPRGDPGAEHATAQEADERQHADDEALAVAGDREQRRPGQQQDVEQVAGHPTTLGGATAGGTARHETIT